MDERKPNVVYITSDEMKASGVSTYGNTKAFTPNIDKLASEGVQFNQAFTTFPKCVPARSALLTGRYPHEGGHRTLPGFEIGKHEPNLAAILKKNGYTTALYGKNHWVAPGYKEELFDDYSRDNPGIGARKHYRDDLDTPEMYRAMYRPEDYLEEQLFDTFETDNACRFIKEQSTEEQPFFLLMDIGMPHPIYKNIQPYIDIVRSKEIEPPPIEELENASDVLKAYRKVYDLEQLSEEQWISVIEAYYSMISYADNCLGRIMEALDEAGVSDNTLFIFTSDHGDFAGEHGCVEKWDTMFYDCLIKVPLIMRYPNKIPAGIASNTLTDNVDNVPTILALLGEQVPSWVQGQSLMPVMNGEVEQLKSYVFCEGGVEEAALTHSLHYDDVFYDTTLPNYKYKQKVMVEYPWTMHRAKMIRSCKWKLVFRIDGSKELYDLEHDPGELNNVSTVPQNGAVVHLLTEELLKWSIRTEMAFPEVTDMRA